ncbi:uncharacterized protein LY89DRAFT_348618 [Mollisia scopiformis]|uniref:Uncharacterized protein n=1 Tax=Mollisia scopiformis TaxID=149040 RepID=A0A132B6K0_MOLSC|nr:uncharacterized protein LY89DRAFT_348618 [Mollisia scopiformis]KUJ08038.1 hypothetical protein LY89DRAFT_348618 [Mollisia scopiformis]
MFAKETPDPAIQTPARTYEFGPEPGAFKVWFGEHANKRFDKVPRDYRLWAVDRSTTNKAPNLTRFKRLHDEYNAWLATRQNPVMKSGTTSTRSESMTDQKSMLQQINTRKPSFVPQSVLKEKESFGNHQVNATTTPAHPGSLVNQTPFLPPMNSNASFNPRFLVKEKKSLDDHRLSVAATRKNDIETNQMQEKTLYRRQRKEEQMIRRAHV